MHSILSIAGHVYGQWSRWVRLAVITLVALLGCLLAVNVALNLDASRPFLASLMSVSPQSFNVNYRRAWSFWPALVYVRNVEVRGSDANIQWQVEVDEARVSIDVIAFLKRELHVTKLRAQGIGFRARRKIDARAGIDDRIALLPPIPGFEGPPLREAGPPLPDIPDAAYNLWSVRIENIDGRARQIWLDEFHFEGEVRVMGAFFLRPMRWLWVGPANATIVSGTVALGSEELLNGTSGSVDCTIPPFDPRPPVGREVFRFISGDVRLDADISSARAFDYYARIRQSSLVFDGGRGGIHLDGALRSGVVRPLNASLTMSDVKAEREAWLALGSLQVSAKTAESGPSEWLARIAPVELRQPGSKSAAVHAAELRITASTDEIDLGKAGPDFEVHVDLPSARVPNLTIVNRFLSNTSRLHVDGGSASIAAAFDANTGTNLARGVLALGTEGMSAHEGDLHFGGRISVRAPITRMLLDSGDLNVSRAVIDARDVTLRDSNAVLSNWWSSVEIPNATLRPAEHALVDVFWTAKLQNGAPVLAFSKRIPSVPGWVTRLLAGGSVEVSGRLRAGKAFTELSNLRAATGLLRVEGDFRERGEARSGVFRVSAGPLAVGIELKNDETNVVLIGRPVEPSLEAPAQPSVP